METPGEDGGDEIAREHMLQVRDGSRAAFSWIVDRYEARLVSFFHRLGGDRSLAEDCAQEVFLRLYRSRERYSPQARFSTYLFTIARHYWIDVARSKRSRPFENTSEGRDDGSEDPGVTVLIQEPGSGPAAAVEQEEELVRLRRALARLPAGQQDVVMLGVIENLPYSEVAAILGIPVGTVKSRVHAAVQNLRAQLESTPERPTR